MCLTNFITSDKYEGELRWDWSVRLSGYGYGLGIGQGSVEVLAVAETGKSILFEAPTRAFCQVVHDVSSLTLRCGRQ